MMTKMNVGPLVSIIIPVYNVEKYIATSLRSAFAQTYTNIEFVLVDDCGTDASIKVAMDTISECGMADRTRIIHQTQNMGAAAARNAGVAEAKGDFLYFMDADDTLTPDCIELLAKAIDGDDVDFAVANIQLVGMRSVHARPYQLPMDETAPLRYFLSGDMLPSPCNKLIRRSFLTDNNIQFVPGLLHEDILWAYQLYLHSKRFRPIADTTYNYIAHDNSSSRRANSPKRIESLLRILSDIREDFVGGKIDAACHDLLVGFFESWRFNTALLLMHFDGTGKHAKELYAELQSLRLGSSRGLKTWLLKLDLVWFRLLLRPPYMLYRMLQ